jgi:stage IV sporulation protein B
MEGTAKKRKKSKGIIVFILILSITATSGVSAAASAKDRRMLIPMGNTVGIKIESDGVLVVGLSEADDVHLNQPPAAAAGIRIGDIITQLNAIKIETLEDFKIALASVTDQQVTIRVVRNGKDLQFTLTPVMNQQGKAELGVWLRDGIIGIGTVTFYDQRDQIFGALGHSVNDIDTGVILPLKNGSIMKSSILSVVKGTNGTPGELRGTFDLLNSIGTVFANTPKGIFGSIDQTDSFSLKEAIPAAKRDEIKIGKATILSNIRGNEVEEYDIEIVRIYPPGENGVRDMMINVTDQKLQELTGGIVQGMSGSPNIQEGRLIGAVTHVLVNDPCRGYAISIENMLNAALIDSAAFSCCSETLQNDHTKYF